MCRESITKNVRSGDLINPCSELHLIALQLKCAGTPSSANEVWKCLQFCMFVSDFNFEFFLMLFFPLIYSRSQEITYSVSVFGIDLCHPHSLKFLLKLIKTFKSYANWRFRWNSLNILYLLRNKVMLGKFSNTYSDSSKCPVSVMRTSAVIHGTRYKYS